MVCESHPLWRSIRRFPLDDPAHSVPFSTRLRREQGWTPAFASRVLDEYRRFLFLTATHDELMVPSEAVDQAWHLHMIDTRAYWDELCGRVVGRPIHHTPSRGGAAEDSRHSDAYEATLRCYRQTFGGAPPADIWPYAQERFAARYRRVDARDVWVVPKRFVMRSAVVAGAMAVLAGCATASEWATTGFVLMGIVVAMFAFLAWAASQARVREDGSRDDKSARGASCGGGGGGGVIGCGCDGGGGGCGGGGCGGGS